jgi:hypothetical protein
MPDRRSPLRADSPLSMTGLGCGLDAGVGDVISD